MKSMKEAVVELDGEWPELEDAPFVEGALYIDHFENLRISNGEWMNGRVVGTLDEFMALRAEMENKPDWGWIVKAYPWARAIVQNRDGWWTVLERPDMLSTDGLRWSLVEVGHHATVGQGHVFGDWRESLEWRPEDVSREAIINLGEFKIESITMEWTPRIDLPPVGTRCLLANLPGGCLQAGELRWVKNGLEVQIRAHMEAVEAGTADTVAVFSTVEPPHRWHALVAACFEPMPTPADLRIEAAMKASARDAYTHSDNMMRKATIIDLENAGMLTDPGKPEEPEQ